MFTHRRTLPWRATLSAASVGLALLASAPASRAEAVPGDLLVQLASTGALPGLLQRHPVTLAARLGSRPIYRLRLVGAADAGAVITALSADPQVILAEPNVLHGSPEAARNVVWAIGTAAAYASQWAAPALRLPAAQTLAAGRGVRVAVLDTGVDARHPALAGRLLPGHDFVGQDADPADEGSTADAGHGHGTHVAGLVLLAAPQARVMPLRVLDRQGRGDAWTLAAAMLHAVDPDGNPATDDGAHVINLSLASTERTDLLGTVAHLASCAPADATDPQLAFTDAGYNDDKARCAASRGAVTVAAAGNSGNTTRHYPAAEGAYGLLPVAASAANGRLADFSSRGGWVAVAAPGAQVTSTVPGGWGTWSGSSMAAPLAAGVAALLREAHPQLAPQRLVRRIERSAAPLCGTRVRQVDALAALLDLRGADDADCR